MMLKSGVFGWHELMTTDIEAAKSFYGASLGWTFDQIKMGLNTYWLAKVDGRPVAGLVDMGRAPTGAPAHWFSYVVVDDIDARVAAIEAAGGKVQRAPFLVGGIGRIAVVSDKSGADLGLLQRSKAAGKGVADQAAA
jgi:predicted enzyme related to lactoylglutathione lyase